MRDNYDFSKAKKNPYKTNNLKGDINMFNAIDKETTERIILEPEDWTEEEFKTLKKLFGVEDNPNVSTIIISRGMKYHIFVNE